MLPAAVSVSRMPGACWPSHGRRTPRPTARSALSRGRLSAERLPHQVAELGEPFGCIADAHPPLSWQCLREVPVVEGDGGWTPLALRASDQPAVEVEAALVGRPDPSGWIRGQAIQNR